MTGVKDTPVAPFAGVERVGAPGALLQAWVLQAWDKAPVQSAPPQEGAGLVQALVCVPPPQDTEHALHAVQPPFTAEQQAWVLQACVPQLDVAPHGVVRVQDCVPPPQDTEQAPQLSVSAG